MHRPKMPMRPRTLARMTPISWPRESPWELDIAPAEGEGVEVLEGVIGEDVSDADEDNDEDNDEDAMDDSEGIDVGIEDDGADVVDDIADDVN